MEIERILNPSRRTLLKGATALAGVATLAACAGQTSAQLAQAAVTYAQDVANGLAAAVQAMVGLPAATVATITGYAKDAQQAAASLSTSLTQTAGQPIIQQIQGDVQAVQSDVESLLPAGSQAANILADVNAVLQVLLPLVGIALAGVTPAVNPLVSAARLHALPRVVLK